ncbi:MAG: lasso peptide biosynthesis B2 protein [Steroidobacter sp.]
MDAYFLPDHVHVCRTDDGVVFLDLKCERYFGLGDEETSALSGFICEWPVAGYSSGSTGIVDPREVLKTLLTRGLVTRDRVNTRAPRLSPLERTDAIPFRGAIHDPPQITVSHVARFLLSCATASALLRWRSLERIVRRVQQRKFRRSREAAVLSQSELVELVRVFRRLTPLLFTASGACLFDSLALVEFLAKYRVYPVWAIGLHTRPFGAHSWVQAGGLVLNETLAEVEDYTPILAV